MNETISLTFGDQGENHVGMKKHGMIVQKGDGLTLDDLVSISKPFKESKYTVEIYDLCNQYNPIESENNITLDPAYVCVIRKGMDYILNKHNKTNQDLCKEMISFDWDKKYYDTRRKKVLNKNARHNVCFDDEQNVPNYEIGQGTVISFNSCPCLNIIRKELAYIHPNKLSDLICEGNRYFNLKKCGIGWHGDAERRKVIAFRIGKSMLLNFNWYHRSKPVGEILSLQLNHGDLYIMSEKAVGTDWKSTSKYTLRHSACIPESKYMKFK
tara:strand:+ start:350 stop:1156 length:807 start_codon:yes stop_codon:yes gene_type:complete